MPEVDTTAAQPTENVNTNPEAAAPAAPSKAETTEPAAPTNTLGLTQEQAEKFSRFIESNGGEDWRPVVG